MGENNNHFKNDYSYNTIFGRALIKVGDNYQKILPPRSLDGLELQENGYQIKDFKIGNIDFIVKLNLKHIKFIFIDDPVSKSSSYSPESKTIYVVKPDNELCFINSVLHEVGHAMLHSNGGEKNLERELKAWLYSLQKSQIFFGRIKNGDIKILEKYIIDQLKTYCAY